MSPFLKVLLGKGDGSLLKVVKETTDELIYSKEEKAEDLLKHEQATQEALYRQQTLDNEQFNKELDYIIKLSTLEIDDKKSAREREIAVIQSDNSSWLQKNIIPILALLIVGYTFLLWTMILFRNYSPKTNEAMIIGSLSTITVTVIGYYFGSSSSSAIKTQLINNKNKEENNV